MAIFHPFPRLPYELRALIWASTIDPRRVDARALYGASLSRGSIEVNTWSNQASDPYVPELPPAVLHACRESRYQNLYQKVTYRVGFSRGQLEERYLWINYDMDMIDIGIFPLRCLQHVGSLVRRLRLRRKNNEDWFQFESDDLCHFGNVLEYEVVAEDGVEAWWMAWENFYWSCKRENLTFISKETGQKMNSYEVDQMMDDEQAESWRQEEIEEEEEAARLAEEMAVA